MELNILRSQRQSQYKQLLSDKVSQKRAQSSFYRKKWLESVIDGSNDDEMQINEKKNTKFLFEFIQYSTQQSVFTQKKQQRLVERALKRIRDYEQQQMKIAAENQFPDKNSAVVTRACLTNEDSFNKMLVQARKCQFPTVQMARKLVTDYEKRINDLNMENMKYPLMRRQ